MPPYVSRRRRGSVADTTQFHRKLVAYWGYIQQAADQKLGPAKTWQFLRDKVGTDNLNLEGVRIFDMNRVYGHAARIREASNAFMKANPDSPIDFTMVAQDIAARPLAAQNAAEQYFIRFEHKYISDGEVVTRWETLLQPSSLNMTKQELLEEIELNARVNADKYDLEHLGVGDIRITAI